MVKKVYAFMELTVHYSVKKNQAMTLSSAVQFIPPFIISYSSDKIEYYSSIFHMVSSLEALSSAVSLHFSCIYVGYKSVYLILVILTPGIPAE
jgi:hypothetical protein